MLKKWFEKEPVVVTIMLFGIPILLLAVWANIYVRVYPNEIEQPATATGGWSD